MFIQAFLYNMKCLFATATSRKNSDVTYFNDFLKTNTGSHIQTNFILFLVISRFISHCFKKLLKKTFLQ